MKDWNINNSSDDKYIANRTHWRDPDTVGQLNTADYSIFTHKYNVGRNTAGAGIVFAAKDIAIGGVQVKVKGPSYIAFVFDSEGLHYQVTPVITDFYGYGNYSEFRNTTFTYNGHAIYSVNLYSFAYPERYANYLERSPSTTTIYLSNPTDCDVKKTGTISSGSDYISYLYNQIGIADIQDNDLANMTESQIAAAKAVMQDTWVSFIPGVFFRGYYNSGEGSPSKTWPRTSMLTNTELGSDWIQLWGLSSYINTRDDRFSYEGYETQYEGSDNASLWLTESWPYGNNSQNEPGNTIYNGIGHYIIPAPRKSHTKYSGYTDSAYERVINNTSWNVCGVTSLGTYTKENWHTIDAKYLPPHIQKMCRVLAKLEDKVLYGNKVSLPLSQ